MLYSIYTFVYNIKMPLYHYCVEENDDERAHSS